MASSDEPFSLFHLEPAPALDAEKLKETFHRATAELHPDKFQTLPEAERAEAERRYAAFNRAYQILRDPKERLLHLYQLEKGGKPRDVQRIPPGTMDLFVEIGQLCQNIDQHLKEMAGAEGALAKANLIGASLQHQEALDLVIQKLRELETALEGETASLDAAWRRGEKDFDRLETLYRKYSYLTRWKQQIDERQMALLTG